MNDYSPISIEVNGVSVIYNNSVKALDDVSFELNGGTVCGLIGMNGSGKSSLFNTIMGIIKPQKGSVFLNKMPVKKAIRENMVSYVPQAEQIDWNFPIRVYDVVTQGRFAHMGFLRNPSMKDKQMVDEALIKMDISNLAHRQIGELSGGQKKRVFLARTLAQQSKIILLDEPFTGVDVKTELAIMHLLEELRQQGYLILVATHNLGSVPDYCNEVIMLNRSLIVAGKTDLVFTQENLIQTFGGVLKNILLDTKDKTAIHVVSDDERAAVFYNYKPVSRPDCE